ncbi:MAG: hypothetical protein ABI234_03015 [Ktedonobacteraceae bacterium]
MDDHTQTDTPLSVASLNKRKKQLKKQAKREARAMHALDQAQRDLQKAERKLVSVQHDFQQRQIDLETCAAKLVKIRTSSFAETTFSKIPSPSELEQGIILHIVEAEEEEVTDNEQSFITQEENLEQIFDASETVILTLSEMDKIASEISEEDLASQEAAEIEQSTHSDNIEVPTPTETPAQPARTSITRRSKTNATPRTTTTRRSPSSRAKPNETGES